MKVLIVYILFIVIYYWNVHSVWKLICPDHWITNVPQAVRSQVISCLLVSWLFWEPGVWSCINRIQSGQLFSASYYWEWEDKCISLNWLIWCTSSYRVILSMWLIHFTVGPITHNILFYFHFWSTNFCVCVFKFIQ